MWDDQFPGLVFTNQFGHNFSNTTLSHAVARIGEKIGVPGLRFHDLRHSAISLLIDLGFSATAIADRVGHESIDITYHYAYCFPTKQSEMADRLDMERMQKGDKYVTQGE